MVGLFLILLIIILTIKFFLNPMFFEPKLGLVELLEVLESKGERFIEKKKINKKEIINTNFQTENNFYGKMVYSESYYQIVTYNVSSKLNKYYILKLRKSNNLFGKREMELLETTKF